MNAIVVTVVNSVIIIYMVGLCIKCEYPFPLFENQLLLDFFSVGVNFLPSIFSIWILVIIFFVLCLNGNENLNDFALTVLLKAKKLTSKHTKVYPSSFEVPKNKILHAEIYKKRDFYHIYSTRFYDVFYHLSDIRFQEETDISSY